MVVAHVLRAKLWTSCKNKYNNKKRQVDEFWKQASYIEQSVLIFLYFAAYLTGVSALLNRVAPGNPVAVQAVCGILLVFY